MLSKDKILPGGLLHVTLQKSFANRVPFPITGLFSDPQSNFDWTGVLQNSTLDAINFLFCWFSRRAGQVFHLPCPALKHLIAVTFGGNMSKI